ncbi:BamA/TamA family outer membrane protein [Neptunitalea lumnitzerae]|uniref:Bacterial surface antigen (D15) domain-containing protein n=1 Tax=Neptunitalea lumnitzerae TaxID=2965509 RepID=A0ABQ5MKS7_9FLAO|nr:BamA/TamA family outer membrane protein [Neptunitalea sp. Y10]GLB49983.1 hypothetical protein Y10_23510 [Neptunitalea sp. Y10]
MKKIILISILSMLSGMLYSQEEGKVKETQDKKVEFTFMPYVSYNRNLEFMFGLVPMVMYKVNQEDKLSPKSLSGAAAVYTTNGSFFVVAFSRWYFKEDQWRLQSYFGTGDHNSQFFMSDEYSAGFYDFATKSTFFNVGVKRKVSKKLYVGLSFSYFDFETDYYGVTDATSSKTFALEPNLLSDTRDNVYYPTSGYLGKFRWQTYQTWLGNDEQANRVFVDYNKYWPLHKGNDVLATRVAGSFGLGDIGFEQQEVLGGKDIRGYTEGKYRGDGLLSLQGEYRLNFADRMGVTGFLGLATIYGSDTEDFNWDIYPGIGVGYRYKAFKDSPFTVGVDGALGKDDWGVYFRIGEAF